MNYTSQKGLLIEIQCQKKFTECGILLPQPIINDSRYDFLADINNKIYKIQCKSSYMKDEDEDAFVFQTANRNWNKGNYKSYDGQIDFFYTYFKGVDYLFPAEEATNRSKILRLQLQHKYYDENRVTWAKDYEFEKILKEKLHYTIPKYTPIALKKEKKKYCKICNKEIYKTSTYCRSCAGKIKQEKRSGLKIPNREELKLMIRESPFLKIAEKYNVSDNAIRKWCDKYNLPRKKHDIENYSEEDWSLL